MGSKVLKQKLYEYEATLKHRDNQIKEFQDILNSKNAELKQLLELTKQNGKKTEDRQRSLSDQPKEQAVESYVEGKENRIKAIEEEIKTLRFAVDEKQKKIESLSSAVEHKEQEWEFKINEEKAQMNGIMAEKDARIKKLEELLKNSETELERHTTKDQFFKKQIEMKEKSLKIARSSAKDKEKEIDKMVRSSHKFRPQFRILRGYTNRTCIEMAFPHHNATHRNQRHCRKTKFFRAE